MMSMSYHTYKPIPQVSAQTASAKPLPAGGKEGVNFASDDDMDKANAEPEPE